MKKIIIGVLLVTSLAYASFISSSGGGGDVTSSGTNTFTGANTFDIAPVCSSLTASRIVLTNGSKALSSGNWNEGSSGEWLYQGSAKGTVSAPLMQLSSSKDSGFYLNASAFDRLSFVEDGVLAASIGSNPEFFVHGFPATDYLSHRVLGNEYTMAANSSGTSFNSIGFRSVSGASESSFYLRDSSGNQQLQITTVPNTGSTPRHFYMSGPGGDATADQVDFINVTRGGGLGIGGGTNNLANHNALTVMARADWTMTGTTTANNTTTITGSSTNFVEDVGIGDQIALSSASSTFATVISVASATSMTVDTALGNGTSQSIIRRQAPLRIKDRSGNQVNYIAPNGANTIGSSTTLVTHSLYGNLNGGSLLPTLIAPSAVMNLADTASVTLNPTLSNSFLLTATGNRTILAPTGCQNGQKITIRHKASGADRTLSLTTGSAGAFRFGDDIPALTATVSGKTDYIGAECNTTDSRWDVISYVKGY